MPGPRTITIHPFARACLPYPLLALLALLVMAPALLAPPMVHTSFWIDIVWIDGFTAALRRGVLYPRWLAESHGGLGAPVFYYYAPLGFYWTGLFGLLGMGSYAALLAAAGSAWFASGAAMLLWLRDCGRRALLGAALYMVLPYHVIDFYRRGALAEFCAYAILPLLALALRRASRGRGLGALAFAYAALILTHLPTALLASLLLIAPWCAWLAWRDRAAALPLAAGLGLGLGLSAIYLLPALTLQAHVSIDQLWGLDTLRAANWTLFHRARWPDPGTAALLLCLTGLIAVTAATLLRTSGRRWAAGAIAICAVVAGFVPGLWDVPLLAKVQFPWRALLLADFALATAFARARVTGPAAFAGGALLLVAALFLAQAVHAPGSWTVAELERRHPEVLEYLPHGASPERGIFSQWALDLARRQPPEMRQGDRTILATFYFPAWEVRCGGVPVPTAPDPATRLLSYRGPPGCTTRLVALPIERIGAALSLLSLLALAFLTFRQRRTAYSALTCPLPASG